MNSRLLKSTKPIQYITLVYGALYILFIVSVIIGGDYSSLNAESLGVYFLFILFLVGCFFSWSNKTITGIIFLIWNVGMWVVECFFVEQGSGGGFGIILGVPLLVLGVFYILNASKTKTDPIPTKSQQWKLALRLLATTYTILYLIFVFGVGVSKGVVKIDDLLNWPGVILTGLLAIYLIGFILSWKWVLIAGILFIIWYASLFIPALQPIAYNLGPLKLLGFPVFAQGVLYFYYHFKLMPKQTEI